MSAHTQPPDGAQFCEMRSEPLTGLVLFMTVILRIEISELAGLSQVGSSNKGVKRG